MGGQGGGVTVPTTMSVQGHKKGICKYKYCMIQHYRQRVHIFVFIFLNDQLKHLMNDPINKLKQKLKIFKMWRPEVAPGPGVCQPCLSASSMDKLLKVESPESVLEATV